MTSEKSLLWICDPQPRLLTAIPNHQTLITNIVKLVDLCKERYNVTHVLITEQVPEKLGHAEHSIAEAVTNSKLQTSAVSKTELAGTSAIKSLERQLGFQFETVICTGAETHICVFKTVSQLLQDSRDVQLIVVEDCVASITPEHHANAMKIMSVWPRTSISNVQGTMSNMSLSRKPHTLPIINLVRNGSDTELIKPSGELTPKQEIAFNAWNVYQPLRKVDTDLKTKVRVYFEVPKDSPPEDDLTVGIIDAGCSSIGEYVEKRNGVSLTLEVFLFILLNDAGDANFKDTLQFVKAAKQLK